KAAVYIFFFYQRLGIQNEYKGVVVGECVPLLAGPGGGSGTPHPYASTHRRRNNCE
ncbi:hypothetical protein Pcinc_025987, partial [Petrolisthes cinctipes]